MPEDSPPAGSGENVKPQSNSEQLDGTTIGPYRLVHLVGAGGMGDVWLAEQTEPVRRQVAIKIIKAGMDTAQVVARFELERQALALMEHSSIARVLDAGATPQGRPYFVMEYVRGEPLTDYCVKHRLSIGARLDLFAQVCDAVQHAHQKGIIHRDLKPSNVLVALQQDRPIPKIIDFGVAKATAQPLIDASFRTRLGAVIGTPEYMSPEQAEMSGLDVDTRTDVYALGVILYELMTDTLPFDARTLRTKGLDDVRRTIREVDPPRPSERVLSASAATSQERAENSRLATRLKRDLDWITMMALEKDRTRRYQTAHELALDVRRHLSGEAVIAAPPSTAYRFRKFVHRHRAGVAATAFLALFAAASLTAIGFQAHRISEERDRANREASTAKAVTAFLQDDLLAQASAEGQATPGTAPDPNLTVRAALDRAAERLVGKFSAEPLVAASLHSTIGDAYKNLGLYAQAEPHLEAAVDLRRRTLGEADRETLIATSSLGDLYRLEGEYEKAEEVLKNVMSVGRRVLGEDDVATQRAINNLGIVYRYLGRYDDAEPLYISSLEHARRTRGNQDIETLTSMNNLGMLYQLEGRPEAADKLFVPAIDLSTTALGKEHPVTVTLMNNLALSYSRQGRYAEAERLYLVVLDFAKRVWGEQHPNTLTTMANLASVYTGQGRYAEAEPLLESAEAIGRITQGDEHPNTLLSRKKLADLYTAEGKYVEANALSSAVLEARRRVLGEEHPATLESMAGSADILLKEHKAPEAETLLASALASRRRVLGTAHPDTRATMAALASAVMAQQKYADAEQPLREALQGYEQAAPDDWLKYACQSMLGASLAGQAHYAEAEPFALSGYRGLIRLQDRIPADRRDVAAEAGRRIVELYREWGKPEKVAEWRDRLQQDNPSRPLP
jgi:eukaryotic-like serine/threonine-protein kinase